MKNAKPIRPVPIADSLEYYLDVHLSDHYYSRDAEKAKLLDAHNSGTNPLFICGEPHSGKTLLAKELAWDLTKHIELGKRDRSPDKTYVLKFDKSIRNTISHHHIPLYVLLPISGWGASDDVIANQLYADKLSLLKQVPTGAVFILDGVDSVSLTQLCAEPEYDDLKALGTIIITSTDTDSYPEWVVDSVPDEFKYSPQIDFNSMSSEERIILQNAALLPPTGMPMTSFLRGQGREHKEITLKMIHTGQLTEVCSRGIIPTNFATGADNDYEPFLSYILRRAESPHTSLKLYEVFCQVLKKAAYTLTDKDGFLARNAGELFKARGDYLEAIPLLELFLRKQRLLEPQNPVTLAQAFYQVGCIRGFQAITRKDNRTDELAEEAKSLFLQALALQTEHLNRGHIDLARTRLALAQMHVEFSEYPEAEDLANFALSEQLSEFSEDHYEIAETLLGCASLHVGAFSERIARKGYVERAMAIVDKWNAGDETQADTYSMMEGCLTYSDMERRMELQRRAIEIREKCTPHRRHTLYSDHQHLAWLANRNHNYQLEVSELMAAIEILCEMLPPDHPRIQSHWKELEAAMVREGSENI